MDFKQYYLNQASGGGGGGSSYPVFRGSPFQQGYGLGNFFKRFVSWAIPLLKQHALPVARSVGKEIVRNVADIATDALDGKNIKESARDKFKQSISKLQSGQGIKRKNKHKKIIKNNKKFKRDIFD